MVHVPEFLWNCILQHAIFNDKTLIKHDCIFIVNTDVTRLLCNLISDWLISIGGRIAGEKRIWPTKVKFVIVEFLDKNNYYTMTPNIRFKILYMACSEQLKT